MQLPGLCLDVQARRGASVRHRRAARRRPELLFLLRGVDETELIAGMDGGLPLSNAAPAADKVLISDDLSALFGLDLGEARQPDEILPPVRAKKVPASKPNTKESASVVAAGKPRATKRTPAAAKPSDRPVTRATNQTKKAQATASATKPAAGKRTTGTRTTGRPTTGKPTTGTRTTDAGRNVRT